MKEVRITQRYDTFFFKRAEKTKEGYILDSPVIGRTGILVYRNADGTEEREYRPPEEAFNTESLQTLKGKPITVGHHGLVNTQTFHRSHPVGTILSEGRRDDTGQNITADIILYELPTENRELSCGYTADIDYTAGTTPDGEPYDAIQRNIRYNHVAVVQKARAGAVARLNMDGDQVVEGEEPIDPQGGQKEDHYMVKVKIDSGLEYECAPEVKVYIDGLEAKAQETRAEVKKLQDAAEQSKKDIAAMQDAAEQSKKDMDVLQAKCDSLEAEKKKLKEDAEQAAKDFEAKFDSAVKERVSVLAIAKGHKIEKADEMDNKAIKIAVIKAVRGDSVNLDGKSDEYIEAYFDSCKAEKRDDGMEEQRKEAQKHNEDGGDKNEPSIEELEKKLQEDEAAFYHKEVK